MTIGDLIAAGKISLETVVLGDPAMTDDGCMIGVGEGSRTWKWSPDGPSSFACADGWQRGRYSTMEASEAAARLRADGNVPGGGK